MLAFDYNFNLKRNYELLIVMDGCKDGTPDKVRALIKDHLGIKAIVLPKRLGKGGAIIEALKYAKGDLIAFLDADGSISSAELNRLLQLTDQYDLVIGSRYSPDSVLPQSRPLRRVLLSRAFNVLLKMMFPDLRDFSDTQCGVKVFNKRLIDIVNGDFLITDFAFDVNLIFSALRHGFKVKEVGVTWFEKEGGKLSKKFSKQPFLMAFSLLRLRIYYSRLNRFMGSKFFKKIAYLLYSGLSS